MCRPATCHYEQRAALVALEDATVIQINALSTVVHTDATASGPVQTAACYCLPDKAGSKPRPRTWPRSPADPRNASGREVPPPLPPRLAIATLAACQADLAGAAAIAGRVPRFLFTQGQGNQRGGTPRPVQSSRRRAARRVVAAPPGPRTPMGARGCVDAPAR